MGAIRNFQTVSEGLFPETHSAPVQLRWPPLRQGEDWTEGLLDGASVFHKLFQIADDLLEALPMHRVAGLGMELQGGIGDCPCESHFFVREHGVLLPPQDQRRHVNLAELSRMIRA
jgi:hypothetical protein